MSKLTKKHLLISILGIGLAFFFTGNALAGSGGNERKGKYTYRKVYKACHARGEVKSERPPISPDTKTQAQWKRLFDKKKFEEFGCTEEWNKLSDDDIQNIYAYLHGHAADSPSPAKCK